MESNSRIADAIVPVADNISFYFSDRFAMHQLLNYYLDKSGPAHICISTFSMCENAIRNFIFNIEKDKILSIKAILDHSLLKRNLDQLIFAHQVIKNIRLIDNHSKLLLIFNPDCKIAIIGSANFNDNRKWEDAVIFINHPAFDKFAEQFNVVFNKAMPIYEP